MSIHIWPLNTHQVHIKLDKFLSEKVDDITSNNNTFWISNLADVFLVIKLAISKSQVAPSRT